MAYTRVINQEWLVRPTKLPWPSQRLGAATISWLSFSEAVNVICELAASRSRGNLIVTPNIQHFAELERNAEFREAYSKASLVVPDGWPIVVAAPFLGTLGPERVCNSDLLSVVGIAAPD